jgi:GntR family transcriptional regulator, transcriptional repressor for pyruvate dehydrogenase complex
MFINIKEKRLFEKIVDQIKDAVSSGRLKPGDSLPPENELARILGVGRSALREALRILELLGIVVIKKGNRGGTFVQEVPSNRQMVDYFSDHLRLGNINIQELTEARYWIESLVIDIVAQKATKKDLDLLEESIERSEQLYRSGMETEKLYENFNFHILMAKITRNRVVIDMLSALIDPMSYLMVKLKPSATMTANTFKAHREVLALLRSGKWEKAKVINGAHIKELSISDPEFRLRLDHGTSLSSRIKGSGEDGSPSGKQQAEVGRKSASGIPKKSGMNKRRVQ